MFSYCGEVEDRRVWWFSFFILVMCLWIGIWNESQRSIVKKKARECRTEYYFCIYLLGRNMTWIPRPGRITDQGTCINETCYLLARLLNQGGKYIREVIINGDY